MSHSWAIQIGSGVTFTPLKEPDVLVGPTHPSSADPYAMPCVPSQAHTRHAPYVRTLTRMRNHEGRL
jgi:hypothetical protein